MSKSQVISSMIPRPPVVGIFGHIDHGKSTLLDYIRKSNIVATEAGGITQHISAYEITHKNKDGAERKITFLDTPGHEAFSSIRTRGANIADIAVLVVSGEDGVKPQTLEVYKYIKENNLPFIVAISKMDKPNANLDVTRQNLAENGIYVEGYGGDISCVPLSAKTGAGVDELLDIIALQGDILELRGDPEVPASGFIVESKLDPKKGITAVVIIKNGTLSKSEFVAAGDAWAPVRTVYNSDGTQVEELSFSSPAQLVSWNELPPIGAQFKTFLKKDEAIEYSESQKNKKVNYAQNISSDTATMPLIIKADTAGSLEAVENEIMKLKRERIMPKIVSSGVGSVSENDVKTALSSQGAVILGFHTKSDTSAASLAERSGIAISIFDIIYELTEKVSKLLEEREPRIEVEEVVGSAKVLKLFNTEKGKQVIGARVLSGKINLNANFKIMRREAEIGRGRVKELQQSKVAAPEVLEGTEFGAMIESKMEVAPGDILEALTTVTK